MEPTEWQDPDALAYAYAQLQDLLLEAPDVMDFLQEVASVAATVSPGTSCGITLRRDHAVSTVANSDDFAAHVDEIQYGRGQGPCLQTLHTGEAVRVDDMSAEDRWPAYGTRAMAFGVRSSLSLPLTTDGETRGALNLYSTESAAFDPASTRRCEAFARQAATALTLVLRHADRNRLEDQLRQAIDTREIVDHAVGIIMGQQRVDAHEAFGILRTASQGRNRKLRDVAADLIEAVTGKAPQAPRPFIAPR